MRAPDSPTAAVAALAALAALSLAGCGTDFTPGSVLTDLRILAIAPSRPETVETPPVERTVSLDAAVYVPAGTTAHYKWTFCPLTAGPNAAYRCVVPCEPTLAEGDDLRTLPPQSPRDLAQACAPGLVLPDRFETAFKLTVTTPAGTREAVQRVFTNAALTQEVNRNNPVISSVDFPASGRAGAKLPITVRLDPASLGETYLDNTGRTITEQAVIEVYTTQGRFDFDRGDGPTASFKLELKELSAGATEALVYVVARDLRGGQGVQGPFAIAITP